MIDLNGNQGGAGTVVTSVPTLPVVRYQLKFALAGNPQGGPAQKPMKVLVNGSDVASFTFNTSGRGPYDMGWTYKKVTFRATGLHTRIGFRSTIPGVYGAAIDDVTVRRLLF